MPSSPLGLVCIYSSHSHYSAEPKKILSEEEKLKLRGNDALEAWEDEVVEMEIDVGRIYFPLKLLSVWSRVFEILKVER